MTPPRIHQLTQPDDDQWRLAAYLLGELPEAEAAELEQAWLADEDLHERLLAVEDELAYDYLEGRLTSAQAAHYERTTGATERGRRSLEFARTLLQNVRVSGPRRVPGTTWMLRIAAAAAVIAVPLWLFYRVGSMESEVRTLRARAATAEGGRAPAPAPLEIAFVLTPGLTRSEEGAPRLLVPATAAAVRLQLVMPPGIGGEALTATVRDGAGRQLWSQLVTPGASPLTLTVPAAALTEGDCRIALRAVGVGEQTDAAVYSFRIQRP